MTLAQALKHKTRLLAEYKEMLVQLLTENSKSEDEEFYISTKELLIEIEKKRLELVELKVKIHRASESMREKIFMLSELKNYQKHLQSLNTFAGKKSEYGSPNRISYTAIITQMDKIKLLKDTQNEIDGLQDSMDQFNAITKL